MPRRAPVERPEVIAAGTLSSSAQGQPIRRMLMPLYSQECQSPPASNGGTSATKILTARTPGVQYLEKRSMNRAVLPLPSSASETSLMIRAIVLSLAGLSTRTSSTPSVLMLPAKTASPTVLLTGMLSPVTGLSSSALEPLVIVPSHGTRAPGLISTVCPTFRLSALTSVVLPAWIRNAFLGVSFAKALMPLRALPAAMLSINSPMLNKTRTTAASATSPIPSAPKAAIVASVLIPSGLPYCTPAQARVATG